MAETICSLALRTDNSSVKKVLYLSLVLFLTALLIECKENTDFSPGASDPRIAGTWQLIERRYPVDSAYYLKDTIVVQGAYMLDSTLVNGQYVKDSVFVPTHNVIDSIKVTKSVDSTRVYPTNPKQTLTFGTDGKLSANGTEMTYYSPIKYFRLDTTYRDSLFIDFFISTNRANVLFQQGLTVQGNTLMLLPRCDRLCYSKFVRVP